jgi:hypothetical protein
MKFPSRKEPRFQSLPAAAVVHKDKHHLVWAFNVLLALSTCHLPAGQATCLRHNKLVLLAL